MRDDLQACFDEACKIAVLIENEGIEVLVIGAIAMAAHRYIRFTEDVDLAIVSSISGMKRLADLLEEHGYSVLYHAPDLDDPLGGVINITCSHGTVQIINFGERFPAVIEDALASIPKSDGRDTALRVAPIPYLVVLKMYAGGWKSMTDIMELLKRNPDSDLEAIGTLCRKYRLRGWKQIEKAVQASKSSEGH